jgi:hypothetical protein
MSNRFGEHGVAHWEPASVGSRAADCVVRQKFDTQDNPNTRPRI